MTQEYDDSEEDVMELENAFRHYHTNEPYRSISSLQLNRRTVNDKYDSDDSDNDNNVVNEKTNNIKDDITAVVKNQSSWSESIHSIGGKKSSGVVKMEVPMPMPTRIAQQRINTELKTSQKVEVEVEVEVEAEAEEEEVEIPLWVEGIDRFTNWIAKTNISPVSFLSSTKEILDQLNDINLLSDNINNDNNDSTDSNVATPVLTYICYNTHLLLCRIEIDDYRTCEFQIGVYRRQNENCLLDIQELSGEHLTFAHFLHIFKSRLEEREIIEAGTETPDNYGLDMEINLESF